MFKKLYRKTRNYLEVVANHLHVRELPTGCLYHVEKKTDLVFDLGGAVGTKSEKLSLDTGVRFDQNPFNICVFASRVQGFSMQEGIRFSVRWDVKLARKLGYITGNGFSFLRAENEIGLKYGRLPYEYMPDEVGRMSFEEYSRWTSEDDKLLEIARKFRTSSYKKIDNKSQAIQALEAGYVLFTAGKWFMAMNRPSPSKYLLRPLGHYIGGHAYIATGYRDYGNDFENPQTFGSDYADNGVAWIDDLFGPTQMAIYVEEKLPFSVKHEYFLMSHKDKYVKGDGTEIYQIIDGKKRHISEEEFKNYPVTFEVVSQSYIDATPSIYV